MKKCAFLTMDNLEGYVCMDHLLVEPMAAAGWHVENVPWRKENVAWEDYQMVVIRSPWDYQTQPEAFLRVLETIASRTALENSLSVVKWNLDKTYLKELESKGVEIVPTHWGCDLKMGELAGFFGLFSTPEIILKPVISANADDTFRLNSKTGMEIEVMLCELFADRRFMVQPFVESIVSEGEFSLFYFGGQYSHAILKTPKANDFRVQEEHGGIIASVQPTDSQLAIASRVVDALDETPLYARVDLVRTGDERFAVMELELIEPSLYFDTDSRSIGNFIKQFESRWSELECRDQV